MEMSNKKCTCKTVKTSLHVGFKLSKIKHKEKLGNVLQNNPKQPAADQLSETL